MGINSLLPQFLWSYQCFLWSLFWWQSLFQWRLAIVGQKLRPSILTNSQNFNSAIVANILFVCEKTKKIWFAANGWPNITHNARWSAFPGPNKAFASYSHYVTSSLTHLIRSCRQGLCKWLLLRCQSLCSTLQHCLVEVSSTDTFCGTRFLHHVNNSINCTMFQNDITLPSLYATCNLWWILHPFTFSALKNLITEWTKQIYGLYQSTISFKLCNSNSGVLIVLKFLSLTHSNLIIILT